MRVEIYRSSVEATVFVILPVGSSLAFVPAAVQHALGSPALPQLCALEQAAEHVPLDLEIARRELARRGYYAPALETVS